MKMEKETKIIQKTLAEKITLNEERLESLKNKSTNLEREIKNLEVKIENQRFAMKHTSKEQ
jgi:predicted transglutaminase-like protease